jgi:hypothetical protein
MWMEVEVEEEVFFGINFHHIYRVLTTQPKIYLAYCTIQLLNAN